MQKILLIVAIVLVGCAHKNYDTSPEIINNTYLRSYYYLSGNSGIPSRLDKFLEADKNSKIAIHMHGCSGMSWNDSKVREFYLSIGYHVVVIDFLSRGDALSSCPTNTPLNNGQPETINPNRQKARVLELESQIDWLRSKGFNNIIVTAHSEGGKTVQQLSRKVDSIIVHNMDCKSTDFWNPNKENKYLFLYSIYDPWITGNGNYSTKSCLNFNNKNISESISTVPNHLPFGDKKWESDIRNFLNN
jgi:dienelactone hydrolase